MPGIPNTVQSLLWQTLNGLAAPASIAAIAHRSGLNPRSVKFRVRAWVRDGLIVAHPTSPNRWTPTGKGSPETRSRSPLRVWQALRRVAPATTAELVAASGIEPVNVRAMLFRWARLGLVICSSGDPVTYAPPTAPARPLPRRTARDRMWTAIRVLRRFDIPTLAIAAEVDAKAATNFAGILVKGGYLDRSALRAAPGEWGTYRLLRRSGPLTPIPRGRGADRCIFDPNSGTTHPAPCSRACGN